jgi:hypothetical protein
VAAAVHGSLQLNAIVSRPRESAPSRAVLAAETSITAASAGRRGRPPRGGRPIARRDAATGYLPSIVNSCVCGFSLASFLAPPTARSLSFQTMSPRVISDS